VKIQIHGLSLDESVISKRSSTPPLVSLEMQRLDDQCIYTSSPKEQETMRAVPELLRLNRQVISMTEIPGEAGFSKDHSNHGCGLEPIAEESKVQAQNSSIVRNNNIEVEFVESVSEMSPDFPRRQFSRESFSLRAKDLSECVPSSEKEVRSPPSRSKSPRSVREFSLMRRSLPIAIPTPRVELQTARPPTDEENRKTFLLVEMLLGQRASLDSSQMHLAYQ
jgi:hypothetical protein